MNFIRKAFIERSERKALNLTIKKLRPTLGRLFGKHEAYSPEQVAAAIQKAKLLPSHTRYGICLYCSREDYHGWAAERGECSYLATRTELADRFFGGNFGYTAHDVGCLVAVLNKPDPLASGTCGDNYDGAMGFGYGGYQV